MSNYQKKIFVIKANGEKELFDDNKVIRSIQRAGIAFDLQNKILEHVKSITYNNISTNEIYKHIIEFLHVKSPGGRGRYELKRAIMELGPTGFPFEKYIAALLKDHGYETETNLIIQGACVNHEVDVVAKKAERHFIIECKFHNRKGAKSDVKVPLYIKGRFNDIVRGYTNNPAHNTKFHQSWLFTNTKFTSDALRYGRCVDIKMTGWNYPIEDSLQKMIETKNLYPITVLSSLNNQQKKELIDQRIVLIRELIDQKNWFKTLRMENQEKELVTKEAELIVGK